MRSTVAQGLGLVALILFGLPGPTLVAERFPIEGFVRNLSVKLEWRCDWQPPTKIHCIKVGPRNWSTNDVLRWSGFFGLTNTCNPIPINNTSAPGWWVRDFTDNTGLKWSVTSFSQRENCLA